MKKFGRELDIPPFYFFEMSVVSKQGFSFLIYFPFIFLFSFNEYVPNTLLSGIDGPNNLPS